MQGPRSMCCWCENTKKFEINFLLYDRIMGAILSSVRLSRSSKIYAHGLDWFIILRNRYEHFSNFFLIQISDTKQPHAQQRPAWSAVLLSTFNWSRASSLVTTTSFQLLPATNSADFAFHLFSVYKMLFFIIKSVVSALSFVPSQKL